MDIDQIPSNKPTAIILSQPSFAFLTQSVCVRAQSQGVFSRRTVLHRRRYFGGKEQQKQKALLSPQIKFVYFPFSSAGLMFFLNHSYHCINHYMWSLNNNLENNIS